MLLGRAGFDDNPTMVVPVKDGPVVQTMLEHGLISEAVASGRMFDLKQAAMAMLIRTNDGQRLLLGKETGPLARLNLDEQAAKYIGLNQNIGNRRK